MPSALQAPPRDRTLPHMGGRVAEADARIGSEFAGYRIVGLLGRGATSTVYRAFELSLEREVALKLLSPELTRDRRFERRFLRESKLAASLEHPNVIPIFAAGEAEGQLYIAMRLIEGRDLNALLRDHGRLPKKRALTLCGQLAGALDAAHAHGLVHRDVKPSNVLLDQEGTGGEHVFLVDFGLTEAAGSASRPSQTEQPLGTIDYAAPEQIRGEQLDGRADLYSLGCVLYECLVGEPPFARSSGVATLYGHLHEPVPAASERFPVLPKAIDWVFARALAKDPGERFRSGAELVARAHTAFGLPLGATVRPRLVQRRSLTAVLPVGAIAGVTAAVVLALSAAGGGEPAGPNASVALPGYRVTASERLTSGVRGSHPTVGLIALIDDGSGPGPRTLSRITTGALVFRFDSRQISFDFMLRSRRGARLGYYTSNATAGGQFVQQPVVKTGLSSDPNGGQIVNALIVVPPQFAAAVGRGVPLAIREVGKQVVAAFSLQKIVRRFRMSGAAFSYSYSGLYFLGGLHRLFGDAAEPIVTNPTEPTILHASVSARPCLDPACTTLGRQAADAISIKLPREVNVRAPSQAFRGQPALFQGTGVPGQWITILRAVEPGSAPVCTPANFAKRSCAPPIGDVFEGDSSVTTRVRADGTWSLAVPLPTTSRLDPRFGASGRYAAAESPDILRGGLLEGGSSTVLAEAPTDTVVVLAKPALTIKRESRLLAVGIAVEGGDDSARYRLRWRGHAVASGRLHTGGRATALVPVPSVEGRFAATVSAPGAASSSASLDYRPPASRAPASWRLSNPRP
jgi:tRNA A-37 threonylcarbamoyl transferase component Bud32